MPATTTPPAPTNNATAGRFYAMKGQGKGDVNVWNLEREAKNAGDAGAEMTRKAKALQKARDHLNDATKNALAGIDKLNKAMSDANSNLNANDLAAASVAAASTGSGSSPRNLHQNSHSTRASPSARWRAAQTSPCRSMTASRLWRGSSG